MKLNFVKQTKKYEVQVVDQVSESLQDDFFAVKNEVKKPSSGIQVAALDLNKRKPGAGKKK